MKKIILILAASISVSSATLAKPITQKVKAMTAMEKDFRKSSKLGKGDKVNISVYKIGSKGCFSGTIQSAGKQQRSYTYKGGKLTPSHFIIDVTCAKNEAAYKTFLLNLRNRADKLRRDNLARRFSK